GGFRAAAVEHDREAIPVKRGGRRAPFWVTAVTDIPGIAENRDWKRKSPTQPSTEFGHSRIGAGIIYHEDFRARTGKGDRQPFQRTNHGMADIPCRDKDGRSHGYPLYPASLRSVQARWRESSTIRRKPPSRLNRGAHPRSVRILRLSPTRYIISSGRYGKAPQSKSRGRASTRATCSATSRSEWPAPVQTL